MPDLEDVIPQGIDYSSFGKKVTFLKGAASQAAKKSMF
jgi:hypothetical protein